MTTSKFAPPGTYARTNGKNFVTLKGTCRFNAMPQVATRKQIHDYAKIAFLSPGEVLDQLVAHAKDSDFIPTPNT